MQNENNQFENIIKIFAQKFNEYCLPRITELEERRKKQKPLLNKLKNISKILSIIVALSLVYLSEAYEFSDYLELRYGFDSRELEVFFLFLTILFLNFVVIKIINKKINHLNNSIKITIMHAICESFGNLEWFPELSKKEFLAKDKFYKKAGLIKTTKKLEVDDVFKGNYNNVSFEIVEACYDTGNLEVFNQNVLDIIDFIGIDLNTTVCTNELIKQQCVTLDDFSFETFEGIIITLDMNKELHLNTTIGTNELVKQQCLILDDFEFESKYDIFTNDEVYIKSTIIPKIKKYKDEIKKMFNASKIISNFYERKIVIAIHTERDCFQVKNIDETLLDKIQYSEIFNDLISVFKLIDLLKSN